MHMLVGCLPCACVRCWHRRSCAAEEAHLYSLTAGEHRLGSSSVNGNDWQLGRQARRTPSGGQLSKQASMPSAGQLSKQANDTPRCWKARQALTADGHIAHVHVGPDLRGCR